jgi:hypothetical protein
MFDSESRVWSHSGTKVHVVVPREIIRGKPERSRALDSAPIIPQLREIWADLISKSTRKDGKLGLNAFTWLNKATLDIIGLAGEPLSVQFTSKTCSSPVLCPKQDSITPSTRYTHLTKSKTNSTRPFVLFLQPNLSSSCLYSNYTFLSFALS